jgi:hypothetical protein
VDLEFGDRMKPQEKKERKENELGRMLLLVKDFN